MHAAFLLAALSPVGDLQVPPGFSIVPFSGPELANDIYTMTTDDAGRVLVAGRGYVRVLVDDDGDGRADRAIDLIEGLKDGPMGLLAEGESLYVVADGGLKRYRGYNGKDRLRGPPETLLAVKTAGEHDAHAVRRGPDGWLYLLCGNMAGVTKATITSHRSPVKDPVAGTLVRISPDGKAVEVVADGLRNAYGFDFDPRGEAFTFDSDNERDVGLPWYEPCRFYHIVPGGNYGWRSPQISQTWRKPPYFADVVAPVCTTGRGSPTGVACYRHTQFPDRYRGGFFLADWTFGRVYFVPLTPHNSTSTGKPEVFLQAIGESGFAPTALAVHPVTGELLVSIGGRGTRGGVYRIRADKGPANPKPIPVAKRSLDWDADAAKGWLADAAGDDPLKRRQALELLLRWREKVPEILKPGNPVPAGLAHPDPLVRAATGRLVAAAGVPVGRPTDAQSRLTLALAAPEDPASFDDALAILGDRRNSPDLRLQAARIIQLALGDLTAPDAVGTVWEGYTFRKPVREDLARRIFPVLRPFVDGPNFEKPRTTPELDTEVSRLFACLAERESYGWYAEWARRRSWDTDSDVREDFHYLVVSGRLARVGPRDDADRVVLSLIAFLKKCEKQRLSRDRHWSLRLDELAAVLIRGEPLRGDRLLDNPDVTRPEHYVLVKHLRMHPVELARLYTRAAEKDPAFGWTPELVRLLGALSPREYRPIVLPLWERAELHGAILPLLAAAPEPDDAPKFVAGLKSTDPDVVLVCAAALAKLPPAADKADVVAAIRALRRLPDEKAEAPAREALASLLWQRTKIHFRPEAKFWSDWFAQRYPDEAAKLATTDGFDPTAWKQRARLIPWAEGDAGRGQKAFVKATCAACHDGGRGLGPSLAGVGKRFGRDDLLTAILDPNRDVSPRYRPTRVATTDGRAFVGMIVYEAPDGVILQTGPDTTVRLAGELIESRRTLDTSLMPAGLLDKLTDREVADLFAYLRTLDSP